MAGTGSLKQIKVGLAAASFFAAAMFLFASCTLGNTALQKPPETLAANNEYAASKPVAEPPEEYLKEARRLKTAGNDKEAASRLLDLRRDFHDTIWALRASFLLGAMAVEGNAAGNAENYLNEAFDLKDVRDYVLLNLARAMRMKGRTGEAVESYDSILRLYPNSPLRPEALYEKAIALSESGALSGALKAVDEFTSGYPGNALIPDALLKYAQWSWKLGASNAALGALRRIRINYPAHNAAREADKLLADMRRAGDEAPRLGVEERFRRGQKLLDALRYGDAAEEFSYVLKNSGGALRCRPADYLAQAQIKLKRYDAAANTLKMFLNEDGGCKNEAAALYRLGLADLRLGRLEELARIEKRLASRFPDSPERAKVLTLLASLYEDNNDEKSALKIYRAVISRWPMSASAEEAYWKAGWIEYLRGGYLNAYKDFASYSGSGVKSADLTRFIYWSGRAAERAGMEADAASAYAKVCSRDAHSFYCLLASARAPLTSKAASTYAAAPPAADKDRAPGDEAVKDLFPGSRYPAIAELLTLGMTSEAAVEIAAMMDAHKDDCAAMNALAGLYASTGEYGRALGAWKRYFQSPSFDAADGEPALPAMAFPTGIVESVKKAAPDGGVDPYLVAAVMREESAFNPEAISPAGALGLLQIMPRTGSFAAKSIGLKDFDRKALFKPEINIRIGSWYLAYLASRFDNDVVLTIAGYNAGPEAAAGWVKALPRETDEFIEAIPYQETRYYVKRVIRSYAEYLRLSGLDPGGILSRSSIQVGAKAAAADDEDARHGRRPLELGVYVPASAPKPSMQ